MARHGFSRIVAPRPAAQVAFARGWGRKWLEPGDWFGDAAAARGGALDRRAFGETHRLGFTAHEGEYFPRRAALAFAEWVLDGARLGDADRARAVRIQQHSGLAVEELVTSTWILARAAALGYAAARAGATACAHPVASERVDAVLVFFRLGRDLRRCPPKRAALKRWPKDGPRPRRSRLLRCLALADADRLEALGAAWGPADDQARVLRCVAAAGPKLLGQPTYYREKDPVRCALVEGHNGKRGRYARVLDLAAATSAWLVAARGGAPDDARIRAALLADDAAVYAPVAR